jgi:hypothetical protein
MNDLLDITGHFLYITLRIILLPVFVALDCFLGLWIAIKIMNRFIAGLHFRSRQKGAYHTQTLAFKKGIMVLREKLVGATVNTH